MSNGVDPAVHPHEPSRPNPFRNSVGTEAQHGELPPAHHAPLAPSNPLQPG